MTAGEGDAVTFAVEGEDLEVVAGVWLEGFADVDAFFPGDFFAGDEAVYGAEVDEYAEFDDAFDAALDDGAFL